MQTTILCLTMCPMLLHVQLEPELDFDREVYPLGLSPAAGIIVGISQRLTLSGCILMPCFEPTPQAQPILPCLLWHLLQVLPNLEPGILAICVFHHCYVLSALTLE